MKKKLIFAGILVVIIGVVGYLVLDKSGSKEGKAAKGEEEVVIPENEVFVTSETEPQKEEVGEEEKGVTKQEEGISPQRATEEAQIPTFPLPESVVSKVEVKIEEKMEVPSSIKGPFLRELDEIRQKQHGYHYIGDVVIDDETGRIKAIVTDEYVRFYDVNGNVKAEKRYAEREYAHLSKKGNYVGLTKNILPLDYEKYEAADIVVTIMDENLNVLGKLERHLGEELLYISSTGYVIVLPAWEGADQIEIYNKEGRLIRKIKFKGYYYDVSEIDISEDGRYFALSVGGNLSLYTTEGNQLWKRKLSGSESYKPLVSKHGKFIYVVDNQYLYFFDNQGNLVIKDFTDSQPVQALRFSKDENFCVVDERDIIMLFDLRTGTKRWEYKKIPDETVVRRMDTTGFLTVLEYPPGYVSLINIDGEIIWTERIKDIFHGEDIPLFRDWHGREIPYTIWTRILNDGRISIFSPTKEIILSIKSGGNK